jgi:hypothetical protein
LILERVVGSDIGVRRRDDGTRVGEDPLSVFSMLLGERYMENCKCYDRNGV